jgi:predicted dehydrogenase
MNAQTSVETVAEDQRFAVVGCGSIGERHLRNLRSLGVNAVGVDLAPTRRDAIAALGFATASSLDSIGRVDVELICTPAPEHARLAIAAIQSGIDVFIEKPLATTLLDGRAIRDAATSSDRIVAVGYNLRFDAALQELRRHLSSGRVGRLLHLRVEFGQYLPDWRPGRDYRTTVTASSATGGGILLEASHELDVLRWLCGDWSTVTAVVRRLGDLDIDVEDTACAIIETRAGAIAEVHLDFLRRGYARRVTCVGSDGLLEWDLRGGTSHTGADGVVRKVAEPADANAMYLAELRDFLGRVRDRTTPAVTVEDGLAALELVEAIRASSESRATVRS